MPKGAARSLLGLWFLGAALAVPPGQLWSAPERASGVTI